MRGSIVGDAILRVHVVSGQAVVCRVPVSRDTRSNAIREARFSGGNVYTSLGYAQTRKR